MKNKNRSLCFLGRRTIIKREFITEVNKEELVMKVFDSVNKTEVEVDGTKGLIQLMKMTDVRWICI